MKELDTNLPYIKMDMNGTAGKRIGNDSAKESSTNPLEQKGGKKMSYDETMKVLDELKALWEAIDAEKYKEDKAFFAEAMRERDKIPNLPKLPELIREGRGDSPGKDKAGGNPVSDISPKEIAD